MSFIKHPHISTLIKSNFNKSAEIIDEIDECISDLAQLIDSTASTLLITTYCRLIGKNQTHISQCRDSQQTFPEQTLPQILDAWGRPPAGIHSSGPFFWLGAYDQCQSVAKAMINKNHSVQYCRANIHIEAYGIQQYQIPLFYGMCLPIRCNEHSINNIVPILSHFLEKTFGLLVSNKSAVECFEQNDSFFNKFDIPQWSVLAILAFLVLLVLCGTTIDIYRKRRSRKYLVNEGNFPSTRFYFKVKLILSAYYNIPYEHLKTKKSSESYRVNARLLTNITSQVSSICAQDDANTFVYSETPSHALTYKSVPSVRKTLKKFNCVVNSILAFSIRSTYYYLTRPRNRHLNSLHGIRVLSAFWVVIGHAHLFSLEYVGNVRQLWNLLKANEKISQLIFNSSLSVDSFLLISATILAYKVHLRLKQQQQRKSGRTALSLYGLFILCLHRFIRLLPAYLITFLIIYFIFQHIGIFGARCSKDDIWRQLLFVSNFYPNECMPWMWYLALDTQFYIMASIALLLLHTVPIIAMISIVAIIVSSIIYRAIVTLLFRFPTTLISALIENDSLSTELMEKMFRHLYAAPHARIGSFLIGILLGWLLSTKSKRTHSTAQINIARLASFLMLAFSIFGGNYADDFTPFSVFYAATFRVFWAFGLALFIWLCERRYMHVIYSFLAWDRWIFFSRLCYGFYLSHEPILLYFIWTRRSAMMPVSSYYFVAFALEISLLSLLAASLIAFIIETPPLVIERKIFKTIRTHVKLNGIDEETKLSDTDQKSTVQLYRQHDENIELAPILPPMKRTKRWLEENRENLQASSVRSHNKDNCVRTDETVSKTAKKSDDSIGSGPFSTCKSFSEKSANRKPILKDKSFRTPKSATVVVSGGEFCKFTGEADDIVHPTSVIIQKQYRNTRDTDKLMKQKQEMPIEKNHDDEISLATGGSSSSSTSTGKTQLTSIKSNS
uniref:NRF domain-containing protein n=1 Tax=Elaeophora elaphi TaxID=1147741 RepID=A0A0R3RR95_9BILA